MDLLNTPIKDLGKALSQVPYDAKLSKEDKNKNLNLVIKIMNMMDEVVFLETKETLYIKDDYEDVKSWNSEDISSFIARYKYYLKEFFYGDSDLNPFCLKYYNPPFVPGKGSCFKACGFGKRHGYCHLEYFTESNTDSDRIYCGEDNKESDYHKIVSKLKNNSIISKKFIKEMRKIFGIVVTKEKHWLDSNRIF